VDAPGERIERVRRYLHGLAHGGTQVDVMALPGGPSDLEYHIDGHRAVSMVIDRLTGRELSYDGILVGCFYDPGVRELREALDVPVMGVGEGSMLVASCLGHRFSILVGRRKWIPKMSDNALRYGFDRRIASWRPVGVTVKLLHEDPKGTYNTLLEAGRAAVRDDGAEVIILGCAAMEDTAGQLQQELGCPVVDPVAAGFKVIETLADLRVRLNLSTSKLYDYESRGEGEEV